EILEQLGAEGEAGARRGLTRDGRAATGDPRRPSRGVAFAASRLRRIDDAVLVPRFAVDRLERVALRVRQTGEGGDVYLARARILDEPVLHAIERVTLRDDLRLDRLQRVGRQRPRVERARIGECRLDVLDELCADAGEIVSGRAGDDAIEIVRIALRLH